MKKLLLILLVGSLAAFTLVEPGDGITYPPTRKTDSTDVYFGKKVADPYRWLEDDRSAETGVWVQAQNDVTFSYLNAIPARESIKTRLEKLWNYEKYSAPFRKGKFYFFFKNDGIQNQSVLYIQEGLNGKAEVLLDPNLLAKDGTVSLGSLSVREDGKYMAYNLSRAGSDWNEIHVMDLEKRKKTDDSLVWVKFSEAAWDGDGFYYSRYPEPKKGESANSAQNENSKVYFHKLGAQQRKDELVYEDLAHPKRNYNIGVTEDEQVLYLVGAESTSGNSLFIRMKEGKSKDWKPVYDGYESDFNVVGRIPGGLLVHTNFKAPKNRLILVNENDPSEKNWKTLIYETKDLLESVNIMKDKIVCRYLSNVTSRYFTYSFEGQQLEIIGTPLGMSSSFNSNRQDDFAFYTFTNFITPSTVFKYSITDRKSTIHFQPKVDFVSDKYETNQVFYESADGKKIPMFLTHKKGLKLNGTNPTFLYGYGGFNISVTPNFSVPMAVLLEQGFIYAVANIRGGGEFGEEWHKAGTKCNKQTVFDDFKAAANFLLKGGYTDASRLAVHGRSNGGLLIGAFITQNPTFCKVAFPGVGVLDMLRYHKFTIGHFWATDYGRSDVEDEFRCLYAYSPLHNVISTEYPATMITTADHDDRVVPAHSFKFAATLQAHQQGENPILIRIDVAAGHGAGKPISKQIDEWGDMWAFMFKNMNLEWKEAK